MNITATAVLGTCSSKTRKKLSTLPAIHALHQQQIQCLKENIKIELAASSTLQHLFSFSYD